MTDQLATYKAIGKMYATHESVNHGSKEFSRNGVHVNTAESFNGILERAKQGVFHFMSKRHLKRYIGEVAFRWNNREPVTKITKKGLSKIVMQAIPILEQLQNLLIHAVGVQLRRTIYGGIATTLPMHLRFARDCCFSLSQQDTDSYAYVILVCLLVWYTIAAIGTPSIIVTYKMSCNDV